MAFVAYYEHHVAQNQRNKTLDAQVRTFRHNREHYQKITANLPPILSMLTSGDLGRSLSPDLFDADDERPIMNFEKIERGGHVLYMCLDSLPIRRWPPPSARWPWPTDQAARAGMRYNLGTYRRISLFVDEVSNVINQPLIEILNKGAEGGIFTTCAMQTLADLAKAPRQRGRCAHGGRKPEQPDRPAHQRPADAGLRHRDLRQDRPSIRCVGLSHGADAHLGDFSSSYSTQLTRASRRWCPPRYWANCPICSTSHRYRRTHHQGPLPDHRPRS